MQISTDFATIERLLFLANFSIFLALLTGISLFCAQRVPSNRERSHRRTKPRESEKKPVENVTTVKSKRSETSQRTQKSQKSLKRDSVDSIKIIRGQKNLRKVKKTEKGVKVDGETDSQHTEVINIPLGKAAKASSPLSNLTTSSQKKEVERVSDGKKVQFAENLVKSTVSPGNEQKSSKSTKSRSKKSTKSQRSKS